MMAVFDKIDALFEEKRYQELLTFLNKVDCGVNTRVYGMTRLHDAIWYGYPQRVEPLLCMGVDPNILTTPGMYWKDEFRDMNALDMAIIENSIDCAKILIANGAKTGLYSNNIPWIKTCIEKTRRARQYARIILALKRRQITAMRNPDRFRTHELAICVYAERYKI